MSPLLSCLRLSSKNESLCKPFLAFICHIIWKYGNKQQHITFILTWSEDFYFFLFACSFCRCWSKQVWLGILRSAGNFCVFQMNFYSKHSWPTDKKGNKNNQATLSEVFQLTFLFISASFQPQAQFGDECRHVNVCVDMRESWDWFLFLSTTKMKV